MFMTPSKTTTGNAHRFDVSGLISQISETIASSGFYRSVTRSRSRIAWAAIAYLGLVWVAISGLLLLPRSYEAGATVAITPGQTPGGTSLTAPSQGVVQRQIVLLESETVIRRAIQLVGAERIAGRAQGADPGRPTTGVLARLFPPLSFADATYVAARKALNVQPAPQTDFIRVSFRHRDPQIAVEFTNALVQSFTDRYFQIYSNSYGVAFFLEQKQKSEQAFADASAALAQYAAANQLFQVDVQRRLLLERHSALQSALLATGGMIADKEMQAEAIPTQLAQMKGVPRSTQIMALLQTAPKEHSTAESKDVAGALRSLGADPPLLLVKVYQDTVAGLVKLRTEVEGLKSLQKHQKQALEDIDKELVHLSAKEAEFEHLRVEVLRAKDNVEQLGKRALEEQLSQELNSTKLSRIQVVQEAMTPMEPVWPKPRLLLAFGFLLSLLPAAGVYLLSRVPPPASARPNGDAQQHRFAPREVA